MRRFLATIFFVLLFLPANVVFAQSTSGRILLDVEKNGEAWYLNPVDSRRYYLGRPDDAFEIMRTLGLGISNTDLNAFDSDVSMRQRLAGRILLQVEAKGEAYYVNPVDLNKYYLGRPLDAFNIMSDLGLGISSSDLAGIPTSSTANPDIYHSIPFAAQAPFGEWSDPRQQDGCEETVALMAMKWVRGESMTLQEAKDQIIAMSDWEEQEFGYFQDTSAHDTATRIFNRWFDYQNVSVEYDISSFDVLTELENGNLALVWTDGTKVNHSFYTPPGPERHVVLVHGYDRRTGEFIYHDPGTRFGQDLRATASELEYMMRDYASGYHAPIGSGRTAMVTVRK